MYLEVIYYRLEKTIFTSPKGDGTAILSGQFEPREGLAACGAKEYLHFSVILRP